MTDAMNATEAGEGAEAEAPVEEGPDPRVASIAAYDQALKEGKPEDDAAVASLRVLAAAAINGDKRVLWSVEDRKEEQIRRIREG